MATFFMFGKYTSDGMREMSVDRTQKVVEEIRKHGGQMKAMHALLGEHDLLFCVELPDVEAAMKASVALTRMTRISFATCPAVTVETFDRLMTG